MVASVTVAAYATAVIGSGGNQAVARRTTAEVVAATAERSSVNGPGSEDRTRVPATGTGSYVRNKLPGEYTSEDIATTAV